ncbi:polysaccharide pyruvyl transferase family protein [Oscillibacter sp. GMB15532]|uniref:glycosyltransferase n=1 Tax=Oscillibacter sp. GMB15532 TaxID=3230022 RepID=UPI0034DF99FB
MKRNAVMLADTRPALVGTILCQLQKTNPGLFDEAIIYYTDPISEQDRKVMISLMLCRFVRYTPPLPAELFQKPRFSLFSVLMFARYEMFSYLEEFETITWLDTDILIQGDLSGMIEAASKTGAAFIREDPQNKTAENPDRMQTCFTANLPGYDTAQYLYCSGTIVLSQRMRSYQTCTSWCYDKTAEWADILSLPDQGVLNAAIQKFGIHVTPLRGADYCCYPYMGRDCSSAAIIHTWGRNKFWNDWYVYQHYSEWRNYYAQWRAAGGSSLPFEIHPRISVVIPSYKPKEQLIRQCLDSLMAQKRSDWERFSDFEIIIVAEPFEQESLRQVVESYHDLRIRLVFNEERLGIAASLNRGLRMAQGRYIARIDDDDLASDQRLFVQAEYLDAHPDIHLCTSDFEYFGDMNERRTSFEGELARAWSIFTCPFDHPTIMFRRDFFAQNDLYYDEQRGYVEDWELWHRAFDQGMIVGCIHQVLFYHRWMNTGSAGQADKTIEMMRAMIQKNFLELGVSIPTDDLGLIGPWNGRLVNETDIQKLESYFNAALESNRKINRYDQKSLMQVFELRLAEARTGVLPGLVEKREVLKADAMQEIPPLPESYAQAQPKKPSRIKRFFRSLIKPFYSPFRHRYEDRIINIQEVAWSAEGAARRTEDALLTHIAAQTSKMEQIAVAVETLQHDYQNLLDMVLKQAEDTRQVLSSRVSEQAEDTRQILSSKVLEQAEDTRQVLSSKVFEQAEDTQQRLTLVGDHLYDLGRNAHFYQRTLFTAQTQKKKIILMGSPEHSNIGDAAITLGELEFFKKYFADYQLVELSAYDFSDWYPTVQSIVRRDDILFLQGGGNLGSQYPNEEELRRRVISDFPENQIVIFPQTIYFDGTLAGQAELEVSTRVYGQHRNLTLFTRGQESLHVAMEHFGQAQNAFAPDMALLLQYNFNLPRSGVLLCLRGLLDAESGLSAAEADGIEATVRGFDPHFRRVNNLNQGNPQANILRESRRSVVSGELRAYASSSIVVTDRLHGLIFSIITGTPCVALRTYNDKITEFCAMFADSNAVFYIGRDIEKLPAAMERAQKVRQPFYPLLEQGLFDGMAEKIRKAGTL